jgi:peptidoglycan/LPS O-acetylase OafA/YrhL
MGADSIYPTSVNRKAEIGGSAVPRLAVSGAAQKSHAGERLAYVPELDGLRAVAIGAVLLAHTMPGYFPGGFIGVDIFFVLSGYLITTILCREFEREHRIRLGNFYMRRALRLMPALFAMLGVYVSVMVICIFVLADGGFFHDHALAVLSSALYVMNWTLAFDIGASGYLVHTWSLAIEEQFYVLWPLTLIALLRYTDRNSAWKAVLILILIVTAWRTQMVFEGASPKQIYGSLHTRIDSLLIGSLLTLAPLARFQAAASRFSLFPVLLLVAMLMTLSWTSRRLQILGFTLIALCAAWVIMAAMNGKEDGVLRRFLRWAPLNYCGRISYGFYLWHYPISRVAGKYLSGEFENFLATAGLTFVVAAVSYHALELPVLKLGRRFR